MLERVPAALGRALGGVRPGLSRLLEAGPELARLPLSIRLASDAFEDEGRLPPRFTADGQGVSPPLHWSGVPADAAELVLIVEDADPPLPRPLVHAIAHGLPAQDGGLSEGALSGDHRQVAVGRNSYLRTGWLPPDPPAGHGDHRYVFQLFALRRPAGIGRNPGRRALREAIAGCGLARGRLTARYARTG